MIYNLLQYELLYKHNIYTTGSVRRANQQFYVAVLSVTLKLRKKMLCASLWTVLGELPVPQTLSLRSQF